jgi:hypothetical protein
MKGFRREHQDQVLRIEFIDGEIWQGRLLMLCSCSEHYDCCGIVFDLLSTNSPAKHSITLGPSKSPAFWVEMEFIKSFVVLESQAE